MNGKVGALVSLVGESGWICTCPGGGLQNSDNEQACEQWYYTCTCISHMHKIIQNWAKNFIACLKFSISLGDEKFISISSFTTLVNVYVDLVVFMHIAGTS